MKRTEKRKLAIRITCLLLAALMVFGVVYAGVLAIL